VAQNPHNVETARSSRDWVKEGLVALLAFFLIREWLLPLQQLSAVTDLYRLEPILIAVGVCLALDYSRCPPLTAWMLKIAVCLSIIVRYYYPQLWPSAAGWERYLSACLRDLILLAQGEFGAVGAENRTLLFLLGWAMLTYALYTLMVIRQSALWFLGATIVYLVLFQIATGEDTAPALLRTSGLGLMLLTVLRFPWLERRFRPAAPGATTLRGMPSAWIASAAVVIPLLLAAGWFGAAYHGRDTGALAWQDTAAAAWLADKWRAWTDGERIGRTGYDDDDTQLGGKLKEDRSIAFTAVTERLTYWRGTAKSVYTGKGWVGTSAAVGAGRSSESEAGAGSATGSEYIQEVRVVNEALSGQLFAGGPIARIHALETADGRTIPGDALQFGNPGGAVRLAADWRAAYYRLAVLPTLPEPSQAELAANLQLPPDYDERVSELALRLTRNARTNAEKAEAIATYLASNYRYSLKAEAPPADADFVAHFLFDSKVGYCDHFSSAMVVLLRAAGVPARWVKGFAVGEVTGFSGGVPADGAEGAADGAAGAAANGGPLRWEVTVRNSDAHSWVEVYVPERGWTWYEPTPGFREKAAAQGIAAAGDVARARAADPAGAASHTAGPVAVLKRQLAGAWSALAGLPRPEQAWSALQDRRAAAALTGLLIAGGILSAALIAAKRRARRRTAASRPDPMPLRACRDAYGRLLDRCWRKVYRAYGSRPPGRTHREYADALMPALSPERRRALRELVDRLERYAFGGERSRAASRARFTALWRRIKGS
jgi:hypothetical protein